jgi:hypothetical protein
VLPPLLLLLLPLLPLVEWVGEEWALPSRTPLLPLLLALPLLLLLPRALKEGGGGGTLAAAAPRSFSIMV